MIIVEDIDFINSNELCSWHTENGILYPSEFQSWYELKQREGEINYYSNKLAITSPRNNSRFFYDEKIANKGAQNLRIQVTGGNEDTLVVTHEIRSEIQKNSELKTTATSNYAVDVFEFERPFSFTIPLSKGYNTIKVECGNEIDEIHFTVQ